jgi:hypothetical protein
MKTGYLEAAPGVKSAGRLLALIVVVVAMVIALSSFAVLVAAFVSRETEIVGSLVAIITGSFGVAAVGEVMKNWGKKIEAHGGNSGQSEAQEMAE